MITTDNNSDCESLQENSVWYDLRAIRVINGLQQEVEFLEASVKRLQIWLVLSIVILGGSIAAISPLGAMTYKQLQQQFAPVNYWKTTQQNR
ncbi:hypothetical protein BJP36_04000 [Moorena producens JHB]|uniref:Uncharacterized protein n=1 Tax=Moorena producens (strain JHB) TaxID=1454205 RepID=A0A1D9FVM5_MOOP1|nr:hypothetical protein [Moorena producens]AOY79200.1 hypothetical protein BJP36_04000 [Moorena producens JHB]